MDSLKAKEKKWRNFFTFLVATLFFLTVTSPANAQRSIFRSVTEKDQKSETDNQTPGPEKKKGTIQPALDPLSLLGERPKTLAQAIQIPSEYGRISESFEGNPKPLIIHIQDVHVHYEAQKNLANILDKLIQEHGLRLILVEGGSGDTSLSFLRAEATKEKRLEVAEKYLKLGKISGEEYLDIVSENPITLWGIEDESLYDKNLDIFFKVDAIKGKALEGARTLKAIVETLKVNIYSPRLKELERKKYDYEEGKIQAVDYYQYLGDLAQDEKVDLFSYPNFRNFLDASKLEKHIDFKKVDGQHQTLVGKLTQILPKGDLTALAEKGLKYKLNEAGPADYYGYLKEILKTHDPAPGTHQDLDLYIEYILLYADRDHVELFREGKVVEKGIKERLYASTDERSLSEISDKLELLLSFLDLNLSPDDLRAYQADRKAFRVEGWKPFLLEKMSQHHVTLSYPKDISVIDKNLSLLESFYEVGLKRDDALVQNALSKVLSEKVDFAVLIAGGFHTAQITRLLKEQNYSYMVVAPKITQASNLELYHEILKEKAKPASPANENLRQIPGRKRSAGDIQEELQAEDGRGKQSTDQLLKRRTQYVNELLEAAKRKDEKKVAELTAKINDVNRLLGMKVAKDGGAHELTIAYAQQLLDSNLKFLMGETKVGDVHQVAIPQGKKVVVIQLKERDPDFYAGNLIDAFEQRGNLISRITTDRREESVKHLREALRHFRPDFVFLPLHEPVLQGHAEQALREQARSAIFIFYKSLESKGRFNLGVLFSKKEASMVWNAIKAHKSQIDRIPYHILAELAARAHALELGLSDPYVELYVTETLKGGDRSLATRRIVWEHAAFKELSKNKVPLLIIAAHPDDIAIMGGGFVYLARKAGMPVYSLILSTGSGAYIPEIDDQPNLSLYQRRIMKAEKRGKEERNSSKWLGTGPPNLIGLDLLRANPEMSDSEIVRESARQLKSNLKTFLGAHQGSDKIVILINDPHDPHPRHRAVYEEAIKVLEEFSKEREDIELQLVYLTFPEGENYNAFFPFETGIEIKTPTEELKTKVEAARLSSKALAAIAREVVTIEGKGSRPQFGEDWRVEGVRIEPFAVADGGGKRIWVAIEEFLGDPRVRESKESFYRLTEEWRKGIRDDSQVKELDRIYKLYEASFNEAFEGVHGEFPKEIQKLLLTFKGAIQSAENHIEYRLNAETIRKDEEQIVGIAGSIQQKLAFFYIADVLKSVRRWSRREAPIVGKVVQKFSKEDSGLSMRKAATKLSSLRTLSDSDLQPVLKHLRGILENRYENMFVRTTIIAVLGRMNHPKTKDILSQFVTERAEKKWGIEAKLKNFASTFLKLTETAQDGGRGKQTSEELTLTLAQLDAEALNATTIPAKMRIESEKEALQHELALTRRGSLGPTTARDGGYAYKGIPFDELKPGKDVLTESFSGIRYAAYGRGETIDVKGETLARLYGYHYANFVANKTGKQDIKLVVAHDPRPTSKAIRDAQVIGFLEASREKGFALEVIDLGIVTTPLAEHAVRYLRVDGGVIITASHNPIEYNGWKYLEGSAGRGKILLAGEMDRLVQEVGKTYQSLSEQSLRRFDAFKIPPYSPNEKIRNAVIEDYIRFARNTFGLTDGKTLKGKIVLDANGGAVTGIGRNVLERLGMEVYEIPTEAGKLAHKIEPAGIDPKTGQSVFADLEKAKKAFGTSLGMLFDFDADRGELGFGGQETAAFAVAMTLSDYDLKGKFKEGKTAIVMHEFTSNRIREIAEAFGVEVFEVETGEINVVSKMEELRRQGYVVPIGVEGANGGAVFGESTSRDGLFTAILAARVLKEPELYLNWRERWSKRASEAALNPQSRIYIEDGHYTLQDVANSLPKYHTTDPNDPLYTFSNFSMDHREFKEKIQRRFEEKFVVGGEPFVGDRDYATYQIEYFDGTETYDHLTGEGKGGFKMTLIDPLGNQTFIAMRGSKTEPQKMRYEVDTKFPEEIDLLLDLIRSVEMERLGIEGRDETGDYYLLADGRKIKTSEDLSKVPTSKDGGYQILGDPSLGLVTISYAAEIGPDVVLDVSDNKGQIFISGGAKVTGNSYLKASHGNDVVIQPGAIVDSSYIEGVTVGEDAAITNAILATTDKREFKPWTFDREGTFKVTGGPTRIGKGARVEGHAIVVNTAVGEGTVIEGGVYKNSEIGDKNQLSHTKMTLVHTEGDVALRGTPGLPREVSEAWLGYGFRSDQQAFIDSTLHANEIASLRFNPLTKELKPERIFRLPALSFVGRNVVYSSYLGTLNPLKIHKDGLSRSAIIDSRFGKREHLPPVRLLGLNGSESSSHGYLRVDPLSILTSWLRWIALSAPQPSSDLLSQMTNENLTHAMPFSVIGYPVAEGDGLDDWGVAPPGAAKSGLRRKAIHVPYLFTYSPDTIFHWMEELTDPLPPGEKGAYDDLVVEMLETGRALAKKELHDQEKKFSEDQDRERMAQLNEWIEAYDRLLKSGTWQFTDGEKDPKGERSSSQVPFEDLLNKEPPRPWKEWENYPVVLKEENLPTLLERSGRRSKSAKISKTAEVDRSAVIGKEVQIGDGAIIGPGVVLHGRTVIKAGAKVFGSLLSDSTVAEGAFVWGSRLDYADIGQGSWIRMSSIKGKGLHEEDRAILGEGVEMVSSRIEHSRIGGRTKGEGVVIIDSQVGRNHLLEPYATILSSTLSDSAPGVNRGIGSIMVNVRGSGLLINHHLAGRVYNLDALPITFEDEGKTYTVPNTTNVGGGSHVGRKESTGRTVADSTFVGTNTVIDGEDGKITDLGFGSIVAAHVLAGEHLIHFTQKTGPGPKNDRVGAVLRRPDVVMRHIISKTKSAAADPLAVDRLMEAKIKEALAAAKEELALVEAGHTHHPVHGYALRSKEQLEEGIDIFEENLDGRWKMESHRFVGGFWLFDGDRYSWHKIREEGKQTSQSGGEITFATDIGKTREGQEDRILVHTLYLEGVPNGIGDLLAIMDGHDDEQVAQLVKRKLPSFFEKALRDKNGNVQEALRATIVALDHLTKDMKSGTTLSIVYLPKEEKRAYVAIVGDSAVIIENDKEELFLSPEHNAFLNKGEREAAVARGAFYNEESRYLSRAPNIGPFILLTRSLGDKEFGSRLSKEPEIFEVPLEKESVILLATDGLVSDLRGAGAHRARELMRWIHSGLSAEHLVNHRLEEDLKDNVSAIVYRPKVAVKDGATRYAVYTPKKPRWLMRHEPLFRRKASDALKETSVLMEFEGDAKILIFHSSILKEDMGESFSLALDRLAKETGNPYDNEESTFKIVLLIDDSNVRFAEIDSYLIRHGLRREQFYAVVTFDILERSYGNDVKEISRGHKESLSYIDKIEQFLTLALMEENSKSGKKIKYPFKEGNENIVIVASRSQADGWGTYVRENGLKVRLISYEPREEGASDLNLAPLLVAAAAEFVGTENPHEALEDLIQSGSLDILESLHKVHINPVPVTLEYLDAYEEYLNSV